MHYVGRFAPSPSGPLHMGSLVCALASFLDAKSNNGRWLVRVEDIDPPREQTGAGEQILASLEAHALHWDAPIVYQSHRSADYDAVLKALLTEGVSYRCDCTRKRLSPLRVAYDNHCRARPPASDSPSAMRLDISRACSQSAQLQATVHFEDRIQGQYTEELDSQGDFIIHRKDGLYAYQLAVVMDDIAQGITHIVRGSDLLDTTAKQIFLTQFLGGHVCSYAHIPVLNQPSGLKLSKQNHAPALENRLARENLLQALSLLNHSVPSYLNKASVASILHWAVDHWSLENLPKQMSISL